jgi:hypothetical protein
MSEAPTETDDYLVVVRGVIEAGVRDGHIGLEGRTDEEIKNDILEYINDILEYISVPTPQYGVVVNHQAKLINEARRYEAEGDVNLALMFYAAWFEHWLNGMYIAREPMVVLEREEIIRLIRETNLASKTRHIWQLLFGEKLPDDVVQTILKVAEAGNAFVHYKWTPIGEIEETGRERRELHELAQRAAAIVTQLGAIEDRIFFAGSRSRLARILDELRPPRPT